MTARSNLDTHDAVEIRAALSPRSLDVLERASRGLTNFEIAQQLNLTPHGVKWHLAAIYRKLGVSNRTEAASAYLRQVDAATRVQGER